MESTAKPGRLPSHPAEGDGMKARAVDFKLCISCYARSANATNGLSASAPCWGVIVADGHG